MSTKTGPDRTRTMPGRDDVLAGRDTDTGQAAGDVSMSLSSEASEVVALAEETVSTHTETLDEVLRASRRGDAVGVTGVPIDWVVAELRVSPVASGIEATIEPRPRSRLQELKVRKPCAIS